MLTNELESMLESAEQVKSDETQTIALAVGDVLRQGDIYIVRMKSMPAGKPRISRQLAIGTTQGSRHILEGDVLKLIDADPSAAITNLVRTDKRFSEVRPYQIGPAFEIESPVTLDHPEHGNRVLSEAGCYQTVYQRALDSEEREMREAD